jgi:hypothetical protein
MRPRGRGEGIGETPEEVKGWFLVGRAVERPAGFPALYMLAGSFAGEILVELVSEFPGLFGIQKPVRADPATEQEPFSVNTDNPCRTQTMDIFCRNHVTVACCQGCFHDMACGIGVSLSIIQRTSQKIKAGVLASLLLWGDRDRMA